MIEAHDLSKDYDEIHALKGVSFTINDSEVVGLLGPNGAGKTTLMKILTGFLHPSGGNAQVDSLDVIEQTLAVQSRIGYLPENAPLYPDMVVQEYLKMIAELRELPLEKSTTLIAQAIERTGLQDYLIRPIGELSKGYRQRVGLAQAILHQPKVLILDEPTSGLDPSQIVEIRQLIQELAKEATVLISTHILPEVEMTCERVLIINEGEVCADARLEELKATNAAVAALEGSPNELKEALEHLPDVEEVSQIGKNKTYSIFRVTGGGEDLCPRIFEIACSKGWKMAELKPDLHTLETVYRDVVEHGKVRS